MTGSCLECLPVAQECLPAGPRRDESVKIERPHAGPDGFDRERDDAGGLPESSNLVQLGEAARRRVRALRNASPERSRAALPRISSLRLRCTDSPMPDEVLPFRMTPVEVIEIGLGVRLHERANPDVQERKGMRVLGRDRLEDAPARTAGIDGTRLCRLHERAAR